ncbi:unnamed protein product [Ectocarpus sp. CCAP 1310/34]|nr:unnamed protein product [Ectocarpus sp. CCAP 1310/34]
MARLQRGKIRHGSHGKIVQMITAALPCAVAGEEELFLVLAVVAMRQLQCVPNCNHAPNSNHAAG